MIQDQAQQLRRLVLDVTRQAVADGSAPSRVLLAGGKGGVGTTTVAVHLAMALAQRGTRTVLVDADPAGGNVALACGVNCTSTLADVIGGRRVLADILAPGPANLLVAAGAWGLDFQADGSVGVGHVWIDQMAGLADRADVVLIDGGTGMSHTLACLQQAADRTLVVTTPDTAAIMNAYGLLKQLVAVNARPETHLLVNQVPDRATAEQVKDRICRASLRFLGLRPPLAGHLPVEPRFAAANLSGQPLLLSDAAAPACEAIRHLAQGIHETVINVRPPVVVRATLPDAKESPQETGVANIR